MAGSPPGSSVHGTYQARILEWVVISFSRRSSWPRDQTRVSCITDWPTGEAPFGALTYALSKLYNRFFLAIDFCTLLTQNLDTYMCVCVYTHTYTHHLVRFVEVNCILSLLSMSGVEQDLQCLKTMSTILKYVWVYQVQDYLFLCSCCEKLWRGGITIPKCYWALTKCFHLRIHWILSIELGDKYHQYFHFKDGETVT